MSRTPGIPGLKRPLLACLLAAAISLPASSAIAKDQDRSTDARDRVHEIASARLMFHAQIDPDTGKTTVLSKRGSVIRTARSGSRVASTRVVARADAVAPAALRAGGGYQCVVKTDRTRRLKAFNPLRYNASGRSWNIKYLLHPYLLNRARIVNDDWRKQWELCVTGGGDVWNGYHQYLNGASIAFSRVADKSIGHKWGTQVVHGSVNSTMALSVGAGPVSIGASTDVADKDRHTGSTGHDGDIGSIHGMERFNANRVNVAYKSGSTWRWQGSRDFKGNNGHLLVELRQDNWRPVSVLLFATNRAHCSHPFGVRCGDYN